MTNDASGRVVATAPPLAGKRVMVTRRAEQANELSDRLRAYGAEVILAPLVRSDPPTDTEAAAAAVGRFSGYDYVVFTSANAVAAVVALAARTGVDLKSPGPTVFAVGPVTAAALSGAGLHCEGLPGRFTAASLAQLLRAHPLAGRRVLLPRSEVGRPGLAASLRDQGALVEDVAVYTTAPGSDAAALLRDKLTRLDVITFASGSAVAAFASAAPRGWKRPAGLLVAVIGPTTATAADAAGLKPDIVAEDHTAAGLAGAIAAYFERS